MYFWSDIGSRRAFKPDFRPDENEASIIRI
jgi:hypothetical protein